MDVSRETIEKWKHPHEIVKFDIVCLGASEVLVIDVDPADAVITYNNGREPVRVMLSPYLTYLTMPKEAQ